MSRAIPRLFVDCPLTAGVEAPLDGGQAHYLGNVLRLRPGAELLLFNGQDGEWSATLARLSRSTGAAAVERRTRSQTVPDGPSLWFAPIKKTRLDVLIEKATELGVGDLRPVLTQNTEVRRVNKGRLVVQAREAAEQSERLTIPAVWDLAELSTALAEHPSDHPLLVCVARESATPLPSALSDLEPGTPPAILIGPEGGFTHGELDALKRLAFVTLVSLGGPVLRAETAAVAALAITMSVRSRDDPRQA